MIVDRAKGDISEIVFRELRDFLESGDHLIFNDTKVIPARLIGTRTGGGASEIFLVRPISNDMWEVLVRPGKKLKVGSRVVFSELFSCEIVERLPDGGAYAVFHYEGEFYQALERHGQIPLPHYIRREVDSAVDNSRYQTVYASQPGAVAAPTAGLHFTQEMMSHLKEKGVHQTTVTLHVGLGTFRPVQAEDIRDHVMHAERLNITPEAAVELNRRQSGSRRICVGTTSCRALEAVATEGGVIVPGDYETTIFIYPGYSFKYAKSLLTNFHLPGSSLLMLVSAFAGRELIKEAYLKAVKEKFRFFSYGDAMLIL